LPGGKKVPCFEKVAESLAAAASRGDLPEPVGRDPEEEWALYCRIEERLWLWPAFTPNDFAWQFARAEGKMPLEDHAVWFTRAVAIIGAFVQHDATLFLPEKKPPFSTVRDIRPGPVTFPDCTGAIPRSRTLTMYGEMHFWTGTRRAGREEESDASFPRMEEVCAFAVPRWRSGAERRDPAWTRGFVVARGAYWAVQRHYTETQALPPFQDLVDDLGITVGMLPFPMTFYAWAGIRDLHARIAPQMEAVYRGKGGTPAGEEA